MNIVVYGAAGNIGKALCWGFKSLGYHVTAIDNNFSSVAHFDEICVPLHSPLNDKDFQPDKHIVVSALPYTENFTLAQTCIDKKVPYVDLGGSVGTSKRINSYAGSLSDRAIIATDLGLAPGWVNIVAEYMVDIYRPKTVRMYCGGLPQKAHKDSLFNWKKTWSIDGLLNEYKDDCVILRDGEIFKAPGMSGLEKFGQNYEAFRTSGGAAHSISSFLEKGVENCEYKTLRYPGHHNAIKTVLRADLSQNNITALLEADYHDDRDKVIIYIEADKEIYQKEIYQDAEFTAMQTATAFPVVTVVDMIADSYFEDIKILTYSDIAQHYEDFNASVEGLYESLMDSQIPF